VRGRQADPGCQVGWSSRPHLPPSPAASLPTRAETSLPAAQLTPSAPRAHCGQNLKEDARRGYGVGGQPSPKLMFAASISIHKSSALRVCEEEWLHVASLVCLR